MRKSLTYYLNVALMFMLILLVALMIEMFISLRLESQQYIKYQDLREAVERMETDAYK